MNHRLFIRAISRFLAGLLLVTGLLFMPAGTWNYPQGWLLLGILFVPMFIAGLVMMKKNPELLKKRLNVKEEEPEQRRGILFSGMMFLASFLAAGLSCRYGLLMLPFSMSVTAAILFLAAYALYAEVLRENTYLSRTVEVQENQKVIDTGLYGIVSLCPSRLRQRGRDRGKRDRGRFGDTEPSETTEKVFINTKERDPVV